MTEFKEHLEDLLHILRKHHGDIGATQAVLVELIKLLVEKEEQERRRQLRQLTGREVIT